MQQVPYDQLINWIFLGMMGFAAIKVVNILTKLLTSVEQLNKSMAVIIEKSQWHERWLIKHDEEIKDIKRG